MYDFDMLTTDQQATIDHLYEQDFTLLHAPMGGGKTCCTLRAIKELADAGEIDRVLVVAPLKVATHVWPHELELWTPMLEGLSMAIATGTEAERRAAFESDARVVVINFENLIWLLRKSGIDLSRFEGLVIDELSRMKESGGAQFKALRPKLKGFKWRVGLTGTPVSEDWRGLFAQMLVVDGGATLGRRKDAYLEEYFNKLDFHGYKWALKDGSAELISKRIAGVVHNMPDYRDELPPIEYHSVLVEPPVEVQRAHAALEKEFVVDLDEETTVVAESAAIMVGKLQQVANGFIYNEGETERISAFKLDALGELVKQIARPVVIAYWFKEDFDRLRDLFPRAAVMGMGSAVEDWNNKRADKLLLHPRSAGHGLNLAKGGADIIWVSPPWSRDLWEQTNARLWRRGQTETVRVWTITTEGSVELDVLARLEHKKAAGDLFRRLMLAP